MKAKGEHFLMCVHRVLEAYPDLHSTKRGIRKKKRSRDELRAEEALSSLNEIYADLEASTKPTRVELWAQFEIAYAQERTHADEEDDANLSSPLTHDEAE